MKKFGVLMLAAYAGVNLFGAGYILSSKKSAERFNRLFQNEEGREVVQEVLELEKQEAAGKITRAECDWRSYQRIVDYLDQ